MPDTIHFSAATPALYIDRRRLDPWTLTRDEPGPLPADCVPLAPLEAARWLLREGGGRRLPLGVIGPREATAEQLATAEALGARIAELGFQLLCGGTRGVMEAVSRGNLAAGGQPIGLLPNEEWQAANPWVAIPIATGIGNARNAIIARACFALIAIGGHYGTITEMAFGLHYGRLVLALDDAPQVPGAIRCADLDEALERAAQRYLGLTERTDRSSGDPAVGQPGIAGAEVVHGQTDAP